MNKPNQENSYFNNWISVLGRLGAIFFFVIILFLIILGLLGKENNPYLSLLTFIILPGFLVGSLLLIPIGFFWERRRRLKGKTVRTFPRIDFNDPRHQRWAFISVAVLTVFLLFSFFGIYRAFEFTESPVFCGKLCHQVMEPEDVAYHHSPHARVACVQCHIGPGAEWYVRSKLSGLYQIYASIVKNYPRPIPTPVKNLRPAQETCEQCHWPQKFYGAVEQDHRYFLPDEKNTEWRNRMLLFVGGGSSEQGRMGIHWHMNIKNKVYYVATDEKRQQIPWVKSIRPNGEEEIFVSGDEYSAQNPPKGEVRKMDCIDCHNRPSHRYEAPVRSVNQAIASGSIDSSLPFIKREAVHALIQSYESHADAEKKIRDQIMEFYRQNYPDILKQKETQVESSATAIGKIYSVNFFPQMKVSWKEYPDNIGHMNSDGCFRCHDGLHKSASGRVITNNCTVCHSIIAQGKGTETQSSAEGLEYVHPDDVGDAWKENKCTTCHSGELAS